MGLLLNLALEALHADRTNRGRTQRTKDEIDEFNEVSVAPRPLRLEVAPPAVDFEERATITEFEAGVPRDWAEGFSTLQSMPRPDSVPHTRWNLFIDDAGGFLDRWAVTASALGWGPMDLFGCDRLTPMARVDQAGLLWLLQGDEIVALTVDTARIAVSSGRWQTYWRKAGPRSGQVLAWELAA